MKERACTMSAPMSSAYFAELKGETRRIATLNASGRFERAGKQWHPDDANAALACPYGVPGDELWFRENWRTIAELDICKPSEINRGRPIYFEASEVPFKDEAGRPLGKLRTSRFMCKWMARARHIPVLDVRVERLQEITEAGARNEGIVEIQRSLSMHGRMNGYGLQGTKPEDAQGTARGAYQELWESLNGPDSWKANPYVWVIKFPLYKRP